MHRSILGGVFPGDRSHEDDTRVDPRIHLLRKGGSQLSRSSRHDPSCYRNGLVRQRLGKTRGEGTSKLSGCRKIAEACQQFRLKSS